MTTRRPMHLTKHTVPGVPSLRQPGAFALFRELLVEARRRGVRTVAFVLQTDHLHWVVVPESAEALRDATRHVFGQFARRFDELVGRRGKVFVERFWSSCARTARHAWNVLSYVLRNAATSGMRPRPGRLDRYTEVDDEVLCGDRFLRGLFGPGTFESQRAHLWKLLLQMSREPVPFVPLAERLQPALPGL